MKPITDPTALERAKHRFYEATKSLDIVSEGVKPGDHWNLGGVIVVYEPEKPERFGYYEADK